MSTFPNLWKTSKVIPVNKTNHPTSYSDYRPISLLPVLSKICERILLDQILKWVNERNLLNKYQSAYRQGYSTATAILNVVDDMRRQMDDGKFNFLMLFDFSKAFDTISHSILINKLRTQYHFHRTAQSLIKSYLSERNQFVAINSEYSKNRFLTSGVPQGSILGPILFTLYVNDISYDLHNCKYHLYADDLQMYCSADKNNITSCVQGLNNQIQKVLNWTVENGLNLNTAKTKCILIRNRDIDVLQIPGIYVNNVAIPIVDKDLGVIITKNLDWEDHICSVRKKVNYLLRQFWSLAYFATKELKLKLVKTYILPYFTYCCTTFFGMHEKHFAKLQLLFNACTRFTCNLRKFDHISEYSKTILGCTLREYYDYNCCFFMYHTLKQKEPEYLYEKLVKLRSARTNNLLVSKNRIKALNKSFFVRGVTLWNSLPLHIKTSSSPAQFKRDYNRHFFYS